MEEILKSIILTNMPTPTTMEERFKTRYKHLIASTTEELGEDFISFIQSEIELAKKEGQEEYKRFILNILDGHDQVNIENGFATDTKSIRFAIQSRII